MPEILKNRTISNPLDEEFRFQWDKVEYVIPPCSTMSYVGYLSVHAAKKLADKILIGRGRFADTIKNDKIIGHAVSMGERHAVAKALLDRDEDSIDLDVVVAKAKNAKTEKRSLPVGDVAAVVEEKPVGTIIDKPEVAEDTAPEAKEEEEGAPTPNSEPVNTGVVKAANELRFAELKAKGYVSLKSDEREEYKVLKESITT